MLIENQMAKVKWNGANRKHYESFGYVFTRSGDELEVNVKHLTKSSKAFVNFNCDWCSKKFEREYQIGIKSEHTFCDHKCYGEYSACVVELNKPIKICEFCGEEYKVEQHRFNSSRFCSDECRHNGHSKEMQGENHPNYKERNIVNCDWCNKEIKRETWKLQQNTFNFCDNNCKKIWFKEVYSQKEDVIERNRSILLSNLTEGKISFTKSKPQVILNDILTSKGINFNNEEVIGNYSFDVFLYDYDLLIEVNGGYWHCDNRFYNEINYEIQLNRIMMDKKKNSFIKNNYKKPILYLWEFDIETNVCMCEKLIDSFINNNGVLKNYHSFNYENKSDDISLIENLIIPYMDWDFDTLKQITDLSVKEKHGLYNPEKHVIFNCEYCGKEKDQVLSQYVKSKNHYCSAYCRTNAKLTGDDAKSFHDYNCDNCGSGMEVTNYVFQQIRSGKRKSITCSRKCKGEMSAKQWAEKRLQKSSNN